VITKMSKAAAARRKKMLVRATPERDAWLCGFAAALAAINRMHDRPSFIADALIDQGLTGFQLQYAGAERDDVRELRKAYQHLSPAEQQRRWYGHSANE
jgi:hypothetical protein